MLEGFFKPRSVAVVGAAREEGKVGHIVFDNLLSAGFIGPVYPVNPRAAEIHGHATYPTLASLPRPPDLAVIVVPAASVLNVVEECGRLGVPAAVVISAGFKESGPEGGALERDLVRAARAGGVRILGPNCLGLISTAASLNASFARGMPPAGSISFMSQSGALGTAILDWAQGRGVGLADFVSLGNKADLDETDLLRAWRDEEDTNVVVAYLESVADGRSFVEAAADLVAVKPLLALKSGTSDAGARAVSSHTGSLAGSRTAYDAAFLKAGVIQAGSVQELFDHALGFATQPLPSSRGVAILTNAGGPAVMATDACDRVGVAVASLDHSTIDTLRASLPPAAALYNPVDVLGDAGPERYAAAAEALVADDDVGALLVILTPQAMTDAPGTARAVSRVARESGITTLTCFMGDPSVEEARALLRDAGIPDFPFPERAVATLAAMQRYRDHLVEPRPEEPAVAGDKEAVRAVLSGGGTDGHSFITGETAASVAAAYGIPVPEGAAAADVGEATRVAERIGYPVAVKVDSPDILHKSDIGGIRLGVADAEELAEAYEDVLARAQRHMREAVVRGVHVQRMTPPGREVIIGVNRDPQFGPLLMFGLGGIYVEVLRDVTFRLCPVSIRDAHRMISEIRAFGLLRGARGEPPADLDAIAEAIVRVSALVMDFPEIVELDINPLMALPKGSGAVAADVRIGVSTEEAAG
ncbi:MAG: acetate--CoA ligase family protein [Coriobacteriia bacterium]|nr:acetate--CoA ligase family protein [Coriobacteriia bacterium]